MAPITSGGILHGRVRCQRDHVDATYGVDLPALVPALGGRVVPGREADAAQLGRLARMGRVVARGRLVVNTATGHATVYAVHLVATRVRVKEVVRGVTRVVRSVNGVFAHLKVARAPTPTVQLGGQYVLEVPLGRSVLVHTTAHDHDVARSVGLQGGHGTGLLDGRGGPLGLLQEGNFVFGTMLEVQQVAGHPPRLRGGMIVLMWDHGSSLALHLGVNDLEQQRSASVGATGHRLELVHGLGAERGGAPHQLRGTPLILNGRPRKDGHVTGTQRHHDLGEGRVLHGHGLVTLEHGLTYTLTGEGLQRGLPMFLYGLRGRFVHAHLETDGAGTASNLGLGRVLQLRLGTLGHQRGPAQRGLFFAVRRGLLLRFSGVAFLLRVDRRAVHSVLHH